MDVCKSNAYPTKAAVAAVSAAAAAAAAAAATAAACLYGDGLCIFYSRRCCV